jgi:hypothetical protein
MSAKQEPVLAKAVPNVSEVIKFLFSKEIKIISSTFLNEPETYSHNMRLTNDHQKLDFINNNIKNTTSEPLGKYNMNFQKMSDKFILGSYYKIFIKNGERYCGCYTIKNMKNERLGKIIDGKMNVVVLVEEEAYPNNKIKYNTPLTSSYTAYRLTMIPESYLKSEFIEKKPLFPSVAKELPPYKRKDYIKSISIKCN